MPDFKLTDDSPGRVGFFDELNSPNTPAYTLPRVAGSSGQVITIDANGDCNFQSTGSIGTLGSIEFRALPYFDNVNAAASDWSPSGKTITPRLFFNLSEISYNAVKTNNTWRYQDPTNLTFSGGDEDTGVPLPALGFSAHTDGVTNPNVTGNFIFTDAGGTEHTFSFRIDWILIQEGVVGTAARGVILTADEQTIEYNKDGTLKTGFENVTVFAEAVNASETQDVFFEFFVDDVSQGTATAAGDDSPFAAQITLTSASTIGSPKKVECQIREGSASNPILARDQIVIFPLKQGSDGITIILSNEAHTLPTTTAGSITFTGSGTDIEVYEGTTQLSYDDSDPFANSTFRVTTTPTNITVGSASTTGGNTRVFGVHNSMTADNASIEFSIIVKSDEGVERTFIKKQSLAKSKQGAEGSAGSDGRTVTLTADRQVFDYDTNGANADPSSATISAEARNTTGTVFFEFFVNDVSTTSGTPFSAGDDSPFAGQITYTPQADIANMPDKIECEIREGAADGTIVARDQFTTFGLQPGSSAITIAMNNEAHTIQTGPLGDSPSVDYPNSGTNFRVFEGNNQLGYDESGSPAVSTYKITASPSNITAGGASTTGGNTRVFAAHSSMTANDALITFTVTVKRADGTTSDFTRTQSLSKSISGEPAKTVRLTAADYVIEYDQSGLTPDPSSTIALTGTAQGFVDPYFKFTGDGITDETSYTNGTSGTDADTFSFSVPSTYTSTPKTLRVGVAEASAATTEIAFDSITIASVKEGSGNVMAFLTNDSHVFPANSSGAVTDFTGSGTNIEVYEGATQLDYDGSGGTAGHFTVTTDGGTNITPGGISDSGNVAVVADASTGVATDVNTSKIVFTISGKRGNGDAFSITKNQTFSKSTAGAPGVGSTGATGSRTVKGILYYEYATEAGTCDSGNTTTMTHAIRAADWSDDEYNTGFEIVNLTQSSGTLNADITDVNGTTGVITHATMVAWNDGVDQYVIRPLPDQDSNATYDFTATGDSALSAVASDWSVQPPEVQLSKSYQRYWEVEFSATETGVTGSGSISFGTPVPSIRFGVNIQSDNFQTGLKGWRIQRDSGDAEFNNIIARGSLRGGKTGPRDYIAYASPSDDSPLPFSESGGSAAGKSVTSGFYIGPDDSPFDSPYTGSSGGSYDLIIGDATHQLRFDGSKGRLDLKGVANLGVEGTFEAKGNSSLPGVVIYDFANEGTTTANETNVSVRMYAGDLAVDANNSRVSHIVTRTGDNGFGGGTPYNTDGRYEIKDSNSGEMTGGAYLTFDEIVLRADDSGTLKFVHFEADGDARFYNKVGIGRSPTGSYELDVLGDINFTGNLTQNGSTYGGSGGTSANATNAAHVLVTDNESTNEENLITFVEDATSATGNVGLEMDGNFSYNPSTGTVSATIFKGNIDAVDIDVDGTLEIDALSINGTSVTSTAAEINLLDGSTANTVVNSKAVIYGSSGQVVATSATIDRGSFTGDTMPLSVTAEATGSVVVEHRNSSGGAGAGADTNVTHRYAAGPAGGGTDDAEVTLITTHDYNGTDGTFEIKAISDVDAGIVFTFDAVKFRNESLTTTLDIDSSGNVQFHAGIEDKDGNLGTSGQVLSSTGSQVDWVDASSVGGGGTITGSGNANKIAKWSSSSALTDSLITDDGSTVTVGGNLTVNGTTTTVNTTNTTITDNLLELNSGASSNANDSGIIIERGSTGNNALFIWDESADKFALGTTTGTASSTGNITYADAGLIAGTLDISGDIDVDGTANLDVVDIDGAVDMASTLTIDNDLIFTNRVTTDGHVQLYNGTSSTGYAIGVESSTTYYRSSSLHRWYIATLADGGTSDYMQLSTTALTVNAGLNVSGDAAFDTDTLFVDASTDRVGINDSTPSYSLDVNGTGRFTGTLTIGAALEIRDWSVSDTDIDGLITGSTFGQIFEGDSAGHIVLGIRGNDAGDSVSIISGGGNYSTDSTYDTLVAHFGADGKVGIGMESGTHAFEVNGAIQGAAGTNSGDAFYIGNDSKLVDINVANIGALYGTSTTTEGGLKLGSGGPTLYGKSSNLGIGTTAPTVPLQIDSTAGAGILIRNDTATTTSPILEVRGQRSDTNNSSVCGGGVGLTRWAPSSQIVDGNDVGTIYFGGAHGASTAAEANILYTASIAAEADETWADASNMATDLVFRTGVTGRAYAYNLSYGDSEVMRITHEARVGIGTTTPTEKLEVAGNIQLDSSNANLLIKQGSGGTTGGMYFTFGSDATLYAGLEFVYDTRASLGPRFYSQNGYDLTVDSGDDLHLRTDGVDKLTILNAGNVGIGITAPASKLHIVGDDAETAALNTATATTLEVAGNGTSVNSGGAVVFSAASGAWKFAAIKGLVQSGTANTVGDLAFSTRNATSDSTLTERMRVRYNGQVGIGTTSIAATEASTGTLLCIDGGISLEAGDGRGLKFWDNNSNSYGLWMSAQSNGTYGGRLDSTSDYNLYFRMTGGTNRGFVFQNSGTEKAQIDGGGNIFAVGDITAFVSDERLKTRVDTIDNAVEKVCSLNGFIYKFNDTAKALGYDTEKRQVGLSAQEVEKVLPEVIKPAPVDNTYKTLDYAKIVPLLVEAIKEQQGQIEDLQKKLEEMTK